MDQPDDGQCRLEGDGRGKRKGIGTCRFLQWPKV